MENEWENINTLLWCGKIGPIPVGAVVYPFPFMNLVGWISNLIGLSLAH